MSLPIRCDAMHLFAAAAAGCLLLFSLSALDVTGQVENIGEPMADRWKGDASMQYCRNVWDLQAFQGKLYMGYGDMSLNAGPIDLQAWDPKTQKMEKEYTLRQECIHVIHVCGGRIVIPGDDAQGPGAYFYFKDDGGWHEVATPDSQHVLDAYMQKDTVFVAYQDKGGNVAVSSDKGATWPKVFPRLDGVRTFSLFELNGVVYVSGYGGKVQQYGPTGFTGANFPVKGNLQAMPPGGKWGGNTMVYHPTAINVTSMAYIGGDIDIDMKNRLTTHRPFGLFLADASRPGQVSVWHMPLPQGVAEDVCVSGNFAFAVANIEKPASGAIVRPPKPAVAPTTGTAPAPIAPPAAGANGKEATPKPYTVIVYVGRQGRDYKELLRFDAEALGRSIECLDGDIYIGLGCTRDKPLPGAGSVLRIPANLFKAPK